MEVTNPSDLHLTGTGEFEISTYGGASVAVDYGDVDFESNSVDDYGVSLTAQGESDRAGAEVVSAYNPFGPELNDLYIWSGLINGRGRYREDLKMPLTVYTVNRGDTVRFHLAHAGAYIAYRISIDDHKLIVKAGEEIEFVPVMVDFAVIYPGESLVFDVEATGMADYYWVRATPDLFFGSVEILAILSYSASDPFAEPTSNRTECTADAPCMAYNCAPGMYADTECLSLDMLQSANPDPSVWQGSEEDEEVLDYIFNMAFAYGPSMNSIKFTPPAGLEMLDNLIIPCDPDDCSDGCECTHIIDLPVNKTVRLTIANYGAGEMGLLSGVHTFHTHGHNFAVVKMGFGSIEDDPDRGLILRSNLDIDCQESMCINPVWRREPTGLNLVNPVIKNTIPIPSGGYATMQFRSDNPGHWLLHCHLDSHAHHGMALMLREVVEDIKPPPEGFPTCEDFEWADDAFEEYMGGGQQSGTSTPLVS